MTVTVSASPGVCDRTRATGVHSCSYTSRKTVSRTGVSLSSRCSSCTFVRHRSVDSRVAQRRDLAEQPITLRGDRLEPTRSLVGPRPFHRELLSV